MEIVGGGRRIGSLGLVGTGVSPHPACDFSKLSARLRINSRNCMRTAPPARDLLNPDQLERVRKRSNWRGAYLVLHAWITIAGAMAIFAWFPNPATFILCAMVIGSRQLGLLILMHDGSHGVLCASRRLNDFLSQWLCAFPTIADTFVYRRYHLHHHARTLHKGDPDVVPTGHYPITRASLRRKLLRDLTGRTAKSATHAICECARAP